MAFGFTFNQPGRTPGIMLDGQKESPPPNTSMPFFLNWCGTGRGKEKPVQTATNKPQPTKGHCECTRRPLSLGQGLLQRKILALGSVN